MRKTVFESTDFSQQKKKKRALIFRIRYSEKV